VIPAILRAVSTAVRRDLGTFGPVKVNNFFLFVALMVGGAAESGVMPVAAYPFLALMGFLLLCPLSSDPLSKIPATRLALWRLDLRQRAVLRAASLALSPVVWLACLLGLASKGWAFVLVLLAGAGLARAISFASTRVPALHWKRYVPAVPGARELLSVLDFYTALTISAAGTAYRWMSANPDPAAFPILAIMTAVALSTYAQCGFRSLTRYRLLSLRGWQMLAAKDAVFLGVLLLLVLPLDAGVGLTFGLVAVAIGRYSSMVLRLRAQPWRFTGGDVRFGTIQIVLGAVLAFAERQSGAWFLAIAAAGYAVSLYLGGRHWDSKYNTGRRTGMRVRGVAVLLALLGVSAAAAFQGQVTIQPRPKPGQKKEEARESATLRVDTHLVLVPVSVNDMLNHPVTGLEKEHFRVFDNKVEQTITQFAMDDEPIAAGLVFDTSGSMGEKLRRSRMAAREFFRTSDSEDEFFLVEFDNAPHLRVPLTKDTGEISAQLTFSKSHGSTALLDAIYMSLAEMKKSKKNKKALLVISDGGDNNSRYTTREVTNLVRESDVLIYAIGVFGGGTTPEEAGGSGLLSKIAEQSGGRLFEAISNEMPDIAQKIGIELRNRYVIGYSPSNQARDGKYHSIQVKLVAPRGMPQLKAHWRQGYNAPVE
jgi:Ca-activated chloride channel family protein